MFCRKIESRKWRGLSGKMAIVEKTPFYLRKFTPYYYIFLGIPLTIAVFSFIYLTLIVVSNQSTQNVFENMSLAIPSVAKLVIFGLLYILLSSYVSYSIAQRINNHLHYSVIEMYNRVRESAGEDKEHVYRLLYELSYVKKNTPSPLTALLLTLFTGSIAFPVLLWSYEKYLRMHSFLEERIIYGRPFTRKIDASNLLLDLFFTFITGGLWIGFWSYRLTRLFNNHVDRIHYGVSLEKTFSFTEQVFSAKPGYIIASLILATGVFGFLSALGIPSYPLPILSLTTLFAYTVYVLRDKPFIVHVLSILALEYMVLVILGFIGFLNYSFYHTLFQAFEEQVSNLPRDPLVLTIGIFQNNLMVTLAAFIPYLGTLYTGYALSNTGFLYGLIIGSYQASGDTFTPLTLFFLPHTFLELLAYAVAAATAPRIIYSSLSRDNVKRIILAITILFTAALVESLTVVIARQ